MYKLRDDDMGYSIIDDSIGDCGDKQIVKIYDESFNPDYPPKSFAKTIGEAIVRHLKNMPQISDEGTHIAVKDNQGKHLVGFYWDSDDRWKYGIDSREKAMKLARHFVLLYMLDTLPTLCKKPCQYHIIRNRTSYYVYDSSKRVATFYSRKDAELFAGISYEDSAFVDRDGLRSHSNKWHCSIYNLGLSKAHMEEYTYLLMDYMDKKWCSE